MAVLMIAGSGRGAGKTAVGCELMAGLPERRWTAVKVTPHYHSAEDPLWEEKDRDSDKDTGRYLRSGAGRAMLVSLRGGNLESGTIAKLRELSESGSLVVESNRVDPELFARSGDPVVRLAVLAGDPSTWKPSTVGRELFPDAVILAAGLSVEQIPFGWRSLPIFCLPKGSWITPELLAFVREKLQVPLSADAGS